jgi:hypothetical protein
VAMAPPNSVMLSVHCALASETWNVVATLVTRGAPRLPNGHAAKRREEGDRCDEDAESVCGPHTAEVGEKASDWVADADTDGGGDRDQRNRGCAPVLREMISSHAHHQRGLTAADALGGTADEQPGERQGTDGEHTAGDRDPQCRENRPSAMGPGSQPAEDRCGDGTAEQRDGQCPLRTCCLRSGPVIPHGAPLLDY